MKKKLIFCFILLGSLMLCGCGKETEKDVINKLEKKINNIDGYQLNGNLEIINNEDIYTYEVEASYSKENNFKVNLKNTTNNHEQIILRNDDGVYVLTPSLNKSFKFQSDWPYNNSQSYLLQPLLNDIKDDSDHTYKNTKKEYIFNTKVNYSSNPELVSQEIKFDKNLNIKEVIVYDNEKNPLIKMKFTNVDLNANFKNNYFSLKNNMNGTDKETTNTTSKIEDIIYPMYIPNNTTLTSQDKISIDNGERIILTFDGDSPFMLVQETSVYSEEFETIPMYGEPEIIADSVAAVSDSSISWISNGIEYYLTSETMKQEDLLSVAKSISALPVGK